MSLVIRRARPDDIGTVFSLIRELADYEKLSHEVAASEAITGRPSSARLKSAIGDLL